MSDGAFASRNWQLPPAARSGTEAFLIRSSCLCQAFLSSWKGLFPLCIEATVPSQRPYSVRSTMQLTKPPGVGERELRAEALCSSP